jgi:Leucine-rich repeat (LRR) protein
MPTPKNTHFKSLFKAFTSGDYDLVDDIIRQIIGQDDRESWARLLEGTVISKDGRFLAGEELTVAGSRQPSVDYGLLQLIGLAPDDLPVNNTIRKDAVRNLKVPKHETNLHVYWHMTRFPKAIYQLRRLKSLNLNEMKISELPAGISSLSKLESLEIKNNELTSLPDDISACTALQSIDLSLNRLSSLPENMRQLTKLVTLNLSINRLTKWPSGLNHLQSLESLDISYNSIQPGIPEEIRGLQSLKKINLNGNRALRTVPIALTELPLLSSINLERCMAISPRPLVKNLDGERLEAWLRRIRKSYGLPVKKLIKKATDTGQNESPEKTSVSHVRQNLSANQPASNPEKNDSGKKKWSSIPLMENLSQYFGSNDPLVRAAGLQLMITLDDPELTRILFESLDPLLLGYNERTNWRNAFPPNMILKKSEVLRLMMDLNFHSIRAYLNPKSIEDILLESESSAIPGVLEAFSNLVSLRIYTDRRKLPDSLNQLVKLEILLLSDIKQIKPIEVKNLPNLRVFSFLHCLTPTLLVHNCPKLSSIIWAGGNGEKIEVSECPALESIDIKQSSIKSIKITGVKALKSLLLECRHVQGDIELPSLDLLEELRISYPKDLETLSRLHSSSELEILHFKYPYQWGNHDFEDFVDTPIPALRSLKLREITLSNLMIRTFPEWVMELPNLKYLDLSYNKLESIPSDWSALKSLRILNLGNNSLKKLPKDLKLPDTIEELDLSENQLSVIPSTLADLPKLEKLKLGIQSSDKTLKCSSLHALPPEIALKAGLTIDMKIKQIDSRRMKARNISYLMQSGGNWEREIDRLWYKYWGKY